MLGWSVFCGRTSVGSGETALVVALVDLVVDQIYSLRTIIHNCIEFNVPLCINFE